MNKYALFMLFFFSSTCFSETIVIPGCAPDTVKKWQSKIYAEINENFLRPKPPREQKINPTYRYTGLLVPGIVRIWIERRGIIISQELTQSSQWELYDETMLDAISASTIPELSCSTIRIVELNLSFKYGFNRGGRF